MTEHSIDQLSYLGRADYFERRQAAIDRRVILNVYVPTGAEPFTAISMIAPQSAIVGLRQSNGRVRIYYEGAIHGQSMSFVTKLLHAADRMVTNYPTVATAVMDAAQLKQVGTYDVAAERLDVTDQDALDAWRGPGD